MNPDDDTELRRARRSQLVSLALIVAASYASTYAADPVLRRNTNAAAARALRRLNAWLYRPEIQPTAPELSALHAEARRICEEAARHGH